MRPSDGRDEPDAVMKTLLLVGRGILGEAVESAPWTRDYRVITATRSPRAGAERVNVADPASIGALFGRLGGGVDAVLNCAAMTDVDACERDPEAARAAHAAAVRELSAECSKRDAVFVQISTNYVFSAHGDAPLKEDDPTAPASVYGLTKLEGEHYALTVPRVSAVVRTSWIFGNTRNDFVRSFSDRLKSPAPVRVVADQFASATYARDLAVIIGRILASDLLPAAERPGPYRTTYHAANAGTCSRHEMVSELAGIMGVSRPIERLSAAELDRWAAVRPARSALDCSKLERALGIRPRHWREALKACWEETQAIGSAP